MYIYIYIIYDILEVQVTKISLKRLFVRTRLRVIIRGVESLQLPNIPLGSSLIIRKLLLNYKVFFLF